ncbi:sodium/hydrogen exchanger 11 isoform X1 [Monodelphis domestica]|uniref:Solute carrier family 9 member C2 (putative) n=1 Tax=Monodelphis domestica TaxID=13616 RepID=F7BIW7_MONDO|nr:sodium/hydrogen exchanger 11 isoform X1 [Monodelphis domestica]XP_056671538.1 sodium/hydrogen exchanger 11 isoform X1 [Monodelphis domestica]
MNDFEENISMPNPDLICGRIDEVTSSEPHFMLLLFFIIFVAGMLKVVLRNYEPAILTLLSLFGFCIGLLGRQFNEVQQLLYPLLKTNNYVFLNIFLPLMTFMAALEMDFYILKNMFWQILITGLTSFVTAFVFIGYIVVKLNKYTWNVQSCLLFSITIGITDPLQSVHPLKGIGVSKILIDIIRGESLISCGVSFVFFGIYRIFGRKTSAFKELYTLGSVVTDIIASGIWGFWSAKILQYMLADIFGDTVTNVTLCFSMAYLTFYVAEFLGLSGIISVISLGLLLDSLSFRPGTDITITKFLFIMTFSCQAFIFTFMGIVIGCENIREIEFHSLSFIIILFVTVNATRMLTILLVSPVLLHSCYEFSWRWGIMLICAGIKGSFNLILAPDIYNLSQEKIVLPQLFLIYVLAMSIMTMIINSAMVTHSAVTLGLCVISLPRHMAMQNAILHIQEVINNTIMLSKTENILTNILWSIVEEKTKIEYPSFFLGNDEKSDTFPTDEVLIEEARLHVAIIQMSSFETQYKDGSLPEAAARILIGASKNYGTVQGKFMSIYDVTTYEKTRSWLIKVKNMLVFLSSQKDKINFFPPEKSKFMGFIYKIVFSEEFQYTGYIVTLLYFFPMIMHLWPTVRDSHVRGLIIVNYYFVFLCIIEATLKILIMRNRYFYESWNRLEFYTIIFGLIDIICIHLVREKPRDIVLIQCSVILGFFRIIRFFRIFKMVLPTLINIIEEIIKKRLSLMYSITKGYIQSLEDTKFLIKQISSRESIFQKLYEILEMNRRDAVKELGLIEHECREVVIALKTKQAIRNVLGKALKNLRFLWSRGIIDKIEGINMNKLFLGKIKSLNNFPMTVPPPTPEKFLHNIVWLEDKDVLIEFFKEKAQLACFDYGDIICKEGDMPQGLYLIISGMSSLYGSLLHFGIDPKLRTLAHLPRTPYTEYLTSGDIIGELSCLLKREMGYTATCETILQACFISLEDLYEGFDIFWSFLEYKIWLKVAISIANHHIKEGIMGEELTYQRCLEKNNAYLENLSRYSELTIYNDTMLHVLIVYGSVLNVATDEQHFAPSRIPSTCFQIQGTSNINKLLIIQKENATRKGKSSDKEEYYDSGKFAYYTKKYADG